MLGLEKLDPTSTNPLIQDQQVLAAKKDSMGKLKWNAMLNSISQVSAFIGGPLLAGSLPFAIKSVFETVATGATLGAAITGLSLPIIGTMAVAAMFIVTSVASSYIASRIWQSKTFDNYEISAQSTARHIVQEIEAHNKCVAEKQEPTRADGKTWQQYEQTRRNTTPQPGLQA